MYVHVVPLRYICVGGTHGGTNVLNQHLYLANILLLVNVHHYNTDSN